LQADLLSEACENRFFNDYFLANPEAFWFHPQQSDSTYALLFKHSLPEAFCPALSRIFLFGFRAEWITAVGGSHQKFANQPNPERQQLKTRRNLNATACVITPMRSLNSTAQCVFWPA
jgi:hypothetical protein